MGKALLIGLAGLWLLGCDSQARWDACEKAVYHGHPNSWFRERGLEKAISLGFTECLKSNESPDDFARNHIWAKEAKEKAGK